MDKAYKLVEVDTESLVFTASTQALNIAHIWDEGLNRILSEVEPGDTTVFVLPGDPRAEGVWELFHLRGEVTEP